MDISIYFNPLPVDVDFPLNSLGSFTRFYTESSFPDLEGVQIAVVGVEEGRGSSNNQGCEHAPDIVRDYFYGLFHHSEEIQIADLGNIQKGATKEDTYFALTEVTEFLAKKNILTLIIGGGQDLTVANYKGYEKLEQTVNLSVIDNRFNIGKPNIPVSAGAYLNKIILHQPNYLFNASVLGFQTYFVSPQDRQLMKDLFFDVYRLGEIQQDITRAEPIVRNADIVSVDVSAIRNADFKANANTTPNGFYAEQICQIMRYAGMSDKLTSLGIYEYNPKLDTDEKMSAQLIAQMLWCVIDGYANRKKDFPIGTKENYIKYRIHIENTDHELVFYKSDKSDRWWMEIPYPPHERVRFERHHLVPCNYQDYLDASKNHIPDLWWKTYQKLQY